MNKKKIIFAGVASAVVILILLALVLLMPAQDKGPASNEYIDDNATAFVFSDSGITVKDGDFTDYTIEGTALTLDGAGTYVVSGSCNDGSIKIKKGTEGVTLIMNSLELTSSDTAPVSCNKSSQVKIIAASGTTNTLCDSAMNNDEEYADNTNAENAVIKCKDGSDVTIEGTGIINITANSKNGIKSGATTDAEGEASLTIQDVTLNITADINDGINAESALDIVSGNITIDASDDGIHCDYIMNIGSEEADGPAITVKESTEGLEAATLNIYSGNLDITSEDDGLNAANSDLADYDFALNISGGTVKIDAATGDGIDSNGSLTISGGTVEIFSASSGDNQPLDCDGTLSITGGTVLGVGAAGMGNNISSGQTFVIFGSSSQQPGNPSASGISAGSTITIKDADGNTIYTGKTVRNAGYAIFSSAELEEGSTYTLYIDGTSIESAQAASSLQNQQAQSPAGVNTPGTEPPAKPGNQADKPAK